MATKEQSAKEAQEAIKIYRDALQRASGHFAMAIPTTMRKTLTPDRLSKIMLASMSRAPLLLKCTPASIVLVCAHAAAMGLEPNSPLGQLYAVPFWNQKIGEYEAVPIVGYRGYITLARRSGVMSALHARVVHENDEFECEFGLDPKIVHRPILRGEPGLPIAAYCVAEFNGGGKQAGLMTIAEIKAIENRGKAREFSPWKSDWEEMAKKTVIRREAKLWPLSTEFAHALSVDNAADGDDAQYPSDMILDAAFDSAGKMAQAQKAGAGDRLVAELEAKKQVEEMITDNEAAPDAVAVPRHTGRAAREPGED